MYSTASSVYVRGQRRPRSDCADAQSDLGLRCPHMPRSSFSLGASHFCFSFDVDPLYLAEKMRPKNIFETHAMKESPDQPG